MAGLFQEYFFNKKLRKFFDLRDSQRRKKLLPYSEMKTCLVLFDASDEQNSQNMFGIIKELQESGKLVRAVGFVPWKHNPHWCFPKISYDYLNTKNISFTGLPKAEFVNDLLEMQFDMMISFLEKPVPSMFYISSLANAGIKISRKVSDDDFFVQVFDIIIDKTGQTDRAFFEEIKNYLQLLNNSRK